MAAPNYFYRFLNSISDFQENIDYDADGNETYHGIAPNAVLSSEAAWLISKAVYTSTLVNGSTVYLLTHTSFLRNQIWDNRASISFP